MKTLVIDQVGNSEFREVPEPNMGPDELLLDVQHVGLCGSDLNTFNGVNPLVELPRIPGHEIGGVIIDIGANVSKEFQVGQSAFVIPYTTCGTCTSCRQGRVNACQYNQTLGVQRDGGLCDRIVVRENCLVVENTLAPIHLALVEPLSVGFHAVARGRVSQKDTVVILGGGMIGAGIALSAKALGARVIILEVSEAKRQVLLGLGVDAVINPIAKVPKDEILILTNGDGADVVIEAVGSPETFLQAVDLVSFAGRVVYVGYSKQKVNYNTAIFNLKELDIMGSRNATRTDFEAATKYIKINEVVVSKLISKRYNWNNANKALQYWKNNRDNIFKIVIDMTMDVDA